MENDILISIIIPMYNSEKYIKETINSVLSQTYSNIELIVVDDGSTDNSGKLVKRIIKNDPRAKYYYQKNSGAPSARNKGFNVSTGKYIIYFDADDKMSRTALENLMIKSSGQPYDLIIGNFVLVDENNNVSIKKTQTAHLKSIKNYSKKNKIYYSVWLNSLPGNKLYRKEFILNNKLKYSNIKIGQDLNFFLKTLACNPEINIIEEIVLNYRIRTGSISNTYTESILDIIPALEEVDNIGYNFYLNNPEIMETLKYNHFSMQLFKVPRIKNKKMRIEIYKKLISKISKLDIERMNYQFVTVNRKKIAFAINQKKIFTSQILFLLLKVRGILLQYQLFRKKG